MRKSRGMALIASLLLAMSVLVIVTVMLKTMGSELQATKLNGSQLRRHYLAKAALADFVFSMKDASAHWNNNVDGSPIILDTYSPQVTLTLRSDPFNQALVHLEATCEGESVFQVVRDSNVGEGLIFATRTSGPTPNFYSASRRLNARKPPEGSEDGDEATPWRPISPPPLEVFNGAGQVVSFSGEPNKNYAADFRGKFYSVLSGPQGFSAYRYAGSAGWERLPARPAVKYTTAGPIPDSGTYTNPNDDPVFFDAAKDGSALWFVENVPPGPNWSNGASYLQTYDISDEAWSIKKLPKNYAISPDGQYQIKSIALGDSGHAYLLTEPTTSGGQSHILSLRDGSWEVVPPPASEYYTPSETYYQSSAPMKAESLTVDVNNHLLVTAQTTFPNWYTVSEFSDSGWKMGLDTPDDYNLGLTSRNFPASANFKPITVDSMDYLIVGNSTSAFQGRNFFIFDKVYRLPAPDVGALAVAERSRVGGGLRALVAGRYKTTAEY